MKFVIQYSSLLPASRHVEDLFSPLGLCSQVASVRCCLPLSELVNYWHAGTGGFSSRSLVLVGYSAAKWLIWSVFLRTLWQSRLSASLHPAQKHTETSALPVWRTETKSQNWQTYFHIDQIIISCQWSHFALFCNAVSVHLLISWQTVRGLTHSK